jgi:hypothetical protein
MGSASDSQSLAGSSTAAIIREAGAAHLTEDLLRGGDQASILQDSISAEKLLD